MDERSVLLDKMGISNLEDKFREKDLVLLGQYPDMIREVLPSFKDQLLFRKAWETHQQVERQPPPSTSVTTETVFTLTPTENTVLSEVIEEDGSVTTQESPILCTLPTEIHRAKRPRLCCLDTSSHSQPSSTSRNDIIDILNSTAKGKAIIEFHRLFGLDYPTRVCLAECIVQDEYKADTNKVITSERFSELAGLISDTFPGELQTTYYIPARVCGKGKSASGKLYDQYANQNKFLRKVNLRRKRVNNSEVEIDDPSCIRAANLSPAQGNKDIERSILFLKTYTEPWNVISDKWLQTATYRLSRLRDPENSESVFDYIQTYPALTQPGGHLLLDSDFEILFDAAHNRANDHWEEFSQNLKKELRKERIACGDSDAELINAFPSLFPIIPVNMPGKKAWRANRAEVAEGFLVHVKSIDDLPVKFRDMKKTCKSKGTTLHPFPVIVGQDISAIHSSYVALTENHHILVESPRRAVELTFKIFHALQASYPVQSKRLWVVLAVALFTIREDSDADVMSLPDVIRLVDALKI